MRQAYGPAVTAGLAFLLALAAAVRAEEPPAGTILRETGQRVAWKKLVDDAPVAAMKDDGLAGVIGGACVRVFTDKTQRLTLPVPQMVDGQVPLGFFIEGTPPDAIEEIRLKSREHGDLFVEVRLAAKKQEVRLEWSSIVLMSPRIAVPDRTDPGPFRAASKCVQSNADEINRLAKELWPASGDPAEFAANIQRAIRRLQRKARPRSLDALGTLASGENSICTGNANIAAALMRARGIPCRTIAVIPPIGQRLEMHRIAAFHANGQWVKFDPSSLQVDIPARAWQNIVVAGTSLAEENAAMTPRMSAMIGCPLGQEIELLTPGITLAGQDFFWTQAKPLASINPGADVIQRAVADWTDFTKTGKHHPAVLDAATAATTELFEQRMRAR